MLHAPDFDIGGRVEPFQGIRRRLCSGQHRRAGNDSKFR